jgi:Putative sensor
MLAMNEANANNLIKRAGRDLAYLVAVLPLSILAFAVWVTGLTLTLSLLILIVGIFVWLGTTYVFRWTAGIDRTLIEWITRKPVAAVYRRPAAPGMLARVRSMTVDPQTWKDLGWLVLNSTLGFAVAVASLSVTAVVLGYITMPIWWWAIPDPGQQYGATNLGLYTVDSTWLAFLTTAIGLALAPIAAQLNRGIVAAHSSLGARLLGRPHAQRRGRVNEFRGSASTKPAAAAAPRT